MGNILSRFKSLESTKETLARIHAEIEEIEDYKWITLRNQNHIIGFYIFGLSIVYAIIVITVYFNYMQRLKNKGLFACLLYVITFPILAYFLRNILKSYYQHKLTLQEDRLHELKRNKRKILNEIMEKETYKVAKELIEKYDPTMLKEKSPSDQLDQSIRLNQSMNNSILRQRVTPMNQMNQTAMPSISTSKKMLPPQLMSSPFKPMLSTNMKALPPNQLSGPSINRSLTQPSINVPQPFINPALMQRRPNLVRPVTSQDRSIVEKLVDYMVGDGPNNRYALICKFCYSHNGMAHKDEFDYLNFRCCFCNNFNPARKQKPIAPTLTSYENASQDADETLNENLKKFKLDDDSVEKTQLDELENKLNETKLDEETKSTENDEMLVDDENNQTTSSSKENTQELNENNLESKEKLNEQLNDLKLIDSI